MAIFEVVVVMGVALRCVCVSVWIRRRKTPHNHAPFEFGLPLQKQSQWLHGCGPKNQLTERKIYIAKYQSFHDHKTYIVVIEYFGKYTDTNILMANGYYFIKVPLLSHLCSLPTNKPLCICWILVLMPVQLAKTAFEMTMTGRLDVDLAWVLHT